MRTQQDNIAWGKGCNDKFTMTKTSAQTLGCHKGKERKNGDEREISDERMSRDGRSDTHRQA